MVLSSNLKKKKRRWVGCKSISPSFFFFVFYQKSTHKMSSPFSPHETLTRSLQIYLSNNNSNSDNTQVRLADLDNCLLFLNDTNHHNATSQVTYQHAYPNQQLNHYNNMEVELLHCIFTYFKKDGTKSLKQLKEHFLFVSAPNDTTASVFHITFPNKHKEKDLYIRLLSKLRVFAFVPVFKCFLAHPNGRALDPVILTANQQEYILLHGEGAALVITTSVTVRDGAKSVVAELFLQKMMENGHNDGKVCFSLFTVSPPILRLTLTFRLARLPVGPSPTGVASTSTHRRFRPC
ncbi:hypothetical protein AGDE_15461 [Angomonas deanei]|uniref:Uncharacterized protein n=1 Tax=Angomonas deanei TaxID=59799 RepID=A0A7G2CS35_9TRYP|nr:hypothetical protein AGDE_15461 [Angomonas deanei]CAD2222606.1 hypothetical protein, conserved [Angomonas deanei]|eukprot:EPY19021.1 hypothetical protein AGDE_15461 [Angomonas deanei]